MMLFTSVVESCNAFTCSGESNSVEDEALVPRTMTASPGTSFVGLIGPAMDSSIEDVSEPLKLGSRGNVWGRGRVADVIDEMLARELKKPPTFDVKGIGADMGVGRVDEGDVSLEPDETAVSTFHILRVPTGAEDIVSSVLVAGSIFHILKAPHPLGAFFVSASSPVVMEGIGGSLTGPVSLAGALPSAMNSRNALAHVSDASRASLASESSCRVSSKSALIVFISRLNASNSSMRGSCDVRSSAWGGEPRPNMPENRLELTGG